MQVAIQTQQKDSMAGRQRRASESDTTNDVRGTGDEAKAADQKNVDILQMLSKAQDEYDKVKTNLINRFMLTSARFVGGVGGLTLVPLSPQVFINPPLV